MKKIYSFFLFLYYIAMNNAVWRRITGVVVFVLPLILSAQTPIPAGNVSGTWTLAGSPYEVNSRNKKLGRGSCC